MKLVRFERSSGAKGVGLWEGTQIVPLHLADSPYACLADLLEAPSLAQTLAELPRAEPLEVGTVRLLAPLDQQEVWAAGVTYKRSQTARMEESEAAASCYDRVYQAERPEIFFKATPNRVCGPDQSLRIRVDSAWNVPEPECAVVINSRQEIVGYTIGNDMSSRDIEGENPLYLPQAKVYRQCCGLGPCITLADAMPARATTAIKLHIERQGHIAFQGETDLGQMARSFEDLVQWLGRDNEFPTGAFLLTGTGIVPDSDFTLLPGDVVRIEIDGIGTLSNPIVQG